MARGGVSPFVSDEIVDVFASQFEVFEFGDHLLFFDGVFYDEAEIEWFIAGMADVFA